METMEDMDFRLAQTTQGVTLSFDAAATARSIAVETVIRNM